MHVPQTPEARAEAMAIMAVPRNIVSPQANKPVIGIVQVRRGFGEGGAKKKTDKKKPLDEKSKLLTHLLFLFFSFPNHLTSVPNQPTKTRTPSSAAAS